MIRVAIFDFYGVLCSDAYSVFQDNHNASVSAREQFKSLAYRNDQGQLALDQFYDEVGLLTSISAKQVRRELGDAMVINNSVIAIVRDLKLAGLKTAILSNSPGSLHHTVINFGIGELFDVIIASGETPFTKPTVEMFEFTLERLEAEPEETIFIDDNKQNIDAAKSIAINGIHFQSAEHLKLAISQLNHQSAA